MTLRAIKRHRVLPPLTVILALVAVRCQCADTVGQPCLKSRDCGSGQICNAGSCRLTCSGPEDCSSGERCAHGVCIALVTHDAAIADASAPDATAVDLRSGDRPLAIDPGHPFDASVPDPAAGDTTTADHALPDRGAGDDEGTEDLTTVDIRSDRPAADLAALDRITLDESCVNHFDDDGDGWTDCDDPDCYNHGTCKQRSVHVATSGTNSPVCGAANQPCATLAHALTVAGPNFTFYVHAGDHTVEAVALTGSMRMISADGPRAAHLHSGVTSALEMVGLDNVVVEGFEISGDHDQGSVPPSVHGLLHIEDSSNVVVRDCLIHDAPLGHDVVRVEGAALQVELDGVVLYNPAHTTDGGANFTENLAIRGHLPDTAANLVEELYLRNSWLFHVNGIGDRLLAAAWYTSEVLLENNVFGPSAGAGTANPAVSIGAAWKPADYDGLVLETAVVRNNLFVGLNGDAAFSVSNASDVWLYSNVFYQNSGAGLRSLIEVRGNYTDPAGFYVMDNIFAHNRPSKESSASSFYWMREGTLSLFIHRHNLYFDVIANNGAGYSYASEIGVVLEDPGFVADAVPNPSQTVDYSALGVAQGFRVGDDSPVVDQGTDVPVSAGYPTQWGEAMERFDRFGTPRPGTDTWDIGLHEVAP